MMTAPRFSLAFPNQAGHCAAQYEPENDWFRIVWSGFVINDDGVAGATAYLQALQQVPSPLLLNDNSGVTGPWFDSLNWLQHIWAPQVVALGLRYVAHVLPANDFPSALPGPEAFRDQFELQIFGSVAEAEQWLRSCRDSQQRGQVA